VSAPDFELARARFVAGNAAFEAGRFEEAEACFLASLQALPGRPSTLVNLAATRIRLGRPADALPALEQALAAQPADAQAWNHRGVALAALARHAEALQAFDRALACGADDAGLHHRRGLALVALERPEDAQRAWKTALARDEAFVAVWVDLGSLHRDRGQPEQALACLERALALGADDPMLNFQVAALRDAQRAPEAPPRQYVEQLFDGYAEQFDAHLVQGLGYRTPQLLADGLAHTGVVHFATALDLGCGTGLCAAPLEPWVGQLDGVDLSAAMLDKARTLGRHDRLVHGDVVEHLQATERRYALVIAADVFVYLGALEPVFAGVQRVLEPGGVFAFSVEAAEEAANDADPSPGYVLRPTLRYAHAEPYVRALARAHGLQVCGTQRHALRQDHGATITGLCVWLRQRPPQAATHTAE
jgi:predicted TPR repeat methyltransferase